MHESRGQFGHPGRSVAWYVGGDEWGLSNHSIVLSTRKVIVRSWTGLRMDMARAGAKSRKEPIQEWATFGGYSAVRVSLGE